MEFGKVPSEEVKSVDFTLPPDGELTAKIINGKRVPQVDFFIGCAKWGRKEWVNIIYPPKTKEANFLDEYVKHFNSIELNAVFYSIPTKEQVNKWKEKAMQNATGQFLFFPKFPRIVSHIKRLKNAEQATDDFLASISEFGEFLGPCFLQLSDNFGPKNYAILEEYIKSLPADLNVFVELRHADWFKDREARKMVCDMLAKYKKGAVITDVSGRRDVLHMELTIPEIFIRFVGNGKEHQDSDFARIDDWAIRIKSWLDHDLQKVYFFLHQHDELDTPVLANYTIKVFNEKLGSDVPEIVFRKKEEGLFGNG